MTAWLTLLVVCVGALLLGTWGGEDLSDQFSWLFYSAAIIAVWLIAWLVVNFAVALFKINGQTFMFKKEFN